MSLQDLIILSEKCEEFEKQILELKELLKEASVYMKSSIPNSHIGFKLKDEWLKRSEEALSK